VPTRWAITKPGTFREAIPVYVPVDNHRSHLALAR